MEPPPDVEPAEPANSNDTVMGLDFDPEAGNGQEDINTQDEEAPPPADATVVFDTRAGARKGPGAGAGPQGKLIVLKGPKQGAEFTLGPGETSIGRNADNTIVIPDISVSRKHVVLVKQGSGWTLVDQGSGNGTLVNGEKQAEHELQDGDVFVIGDTEIQYAVPGAATSTLPPRRMTGSQPATPPRRGASPSRVGPRPVPGRPMPGANTTGQVALPPEMMEEANKKKRLKTIGMVGGGLLVVLFGVGFVVKGQNNARLAAQHAAEAAEREAAAQAAAEAFAAGKQLVKDGQFAEALPKFQEAKDKGSDDAELDDYIDRCKRESAAETSLKAATDALKSNKLGDAIEAAKKVPVDSLLSDKAEDVKKQIKAAVPGRVTDARGKIALKDYAGAKAILDDAAKVAPDDKGISDAQDEMAKAQNQPVPVHTTQHVTLADHTAEVRQAYKDGDLKRAKELATQYAESDDHCKVLRDELNTFEGAYGKMDDDPGAFKTAHDLDMKIAGGHSFFSQRINTHVLSIKLKQCVAAKSAGHVKEAFQACEAAHEADPTNGDANNVLSELLAKAKDLYLEGYQEKDSDADAARKAFQQVVDTTPSSEEIHQKAATRLKEMQ
ncbi:MAG: FHA domain-containing protein [Deltaproteobacteria bacterium]|nr:FHA domain-containing protein [Deltaproteobacteria bacterium]